MWVLREVSERESVLEGRGEAVGGEWERAA